MGRTQIGLEVIQSVRSAHCCLGCVFVILFGVVLGFALFVTLRFALPKSICSSSSAAGAGEGDLGFGFDFAAVAFLVRVLAFSLVYFLLEFSLGGFWWGFIVLISVSFFISVLLFFARVQRKARRLQTLMLVVDILTAW